MGDLMQVTVLYIETEVYLRRAFQRMVELHGIKTICTDSIDIVEDILSNGNQIDGIVSDLELEHKKISKKLINLIIKYRPELLSKLIFFSTYYDQIIHETNILYVNKLDPYEDLIDNLKKIVL